MFRTILTAALCINVEHIGRILFSNPDTIIHNYGMAFSLLKDYPVLSTVLSGVAIVIVSLVFVFAELNEAERLGYSMILGGAISNFAEKVLLGYVIDWIPIPYFPLTINLADAEICLGAMIAFLNFRM